MTALSRSRSRSVSLDCDCSGEEFLAATAHELRLPLSHIKGFVSSLRRTDVNWDDETRSEFLAEIDQETDRLADLVESLLTAGAADRGDAPAQHLAFARPEAVVAGALHRVRGLLGVRALRVEVSPSLPRVRMDATQIERVLANLVQNATKYSPPGTAIGVSARITENSELEFSVDDDGPGIPAADRERIFAPFFRKPAAAHANTPGHGLGLAICRRIVQAHGGRIQVSDRPAGGTRFSVLIPAPLDLERLDADNRRRDVANEPAIHSRRGRRGADAQTTFQQPQGQRLRGAHGGRWYGSDEADRGVDVRPAAA